MRSRDSYHHGNLKEALVGAAVEAARSGGEAAVGLNRLAGGVGVSASAAYRHFPGGLEELLRAVGDVARRELAERIGLRMSEVGRTRDPQAAARRRFRASGQAYVEYVLEQPGLFQVANRHGTASAGQGDPYSLLAACIDALVDTGALPPERRRNAATVAWAAVHGIAVLLTDGPLCDLPPRQRHGLVARTLDTVERGL